MQEHSKQQGQEADQSAGKSASADLAAHRFRSALSYSSQSVTGYGPVITLDHEFHSDLSFRRIAPTLGEVLLETSAAQGAVPVRRETGIAVARAFAHGLATMPLDNRSDSLTMHDRLLLAIVEQTKDNPAERAELIERLLALDPFLSQGAASAAAFAIEPDYFSKIVAAGGEPGFRQSPAGLAARVMLRGHDRSRFAIAAGPVECDVWQRCVTLKIAVEMLRTLGAEPADYAAALSGAGGAESSAPPPPLVALYARALAEGEAGPAAPHLSKRMRPLQRADRAPTVDRYALRERLAAEFLFDPAVQLLLAAEFGVDLGDLRPRECIYLTRALSQSDENSIAALSAFLKRHGTSGAKALSLYEYGDGVVRGLFEMSDRLPAEKFDPLLAQFVRAGDAIESAMTVFRYRTSREAPFTHDEETLLEQLHESVTRAAANLFLSPQLFWLHPEIAKNRPERFDLDSPRLALRAVSTLFEILSSGPRGPYALTPLQSEENGLQFLVKGADAGGGTVGPEFLLRAFVRPHPGIERHSSGDVILDPRLVVEAHFDTPQRYKWNSKTERMVPTTRGPEFTSDRELAEAFRKAIYYYGARLDREAPPQSMREASFFPVRIDLPSYEGRRRIEVDFGDGEFRGLRHSKDGDLVGELQRLNMDQHEFAGGNHYSAPFGQTPAAIEACTSILERALRLFERISVRKGEL